MTENDPPCAHCRLPRDAKHVGHRYTEAKVTTPKLRKRTERQRIGDRVRPMDVSASRLPLPDHNEAVKKWPLGLPCPVCKRFYTLVGMTDLKRKWERTCNHCGYTAHDRTTLV